MDIVRYVLAGCIAAALVGAAAPAGAQELFSRFGFRLESAHLVSEDPRFNWVFDFGGDLDAIDWGGGRATIVAVYEAIAGEQFRRFDVNQGNYLLEGAVAFRVGGLEVGPVWHHVSRHLSDRSKRAPVDWNMIAVRVRGPASADGAAVAWHADVRRTVMRSFVDYAWEVASGVSAARRVGPRWGVTAAGDVRIVGVDGSRDRGTQAGGRLEAGIRLEGRAAAGELFVAAERRIDPYATDFGTAGWMTVGMRFRAR